MGNYTEELYNYLSKFITENRKQKIEEISQFRTNYMTFVMENIYQPQNASAVLRTCDCLGIQNVHVIENSNEYNVNPQITLGSNKWLTIAKYNDKENNTLDAINALKTEGYRIVATTPHTNDIELDNFDIAKGKFAMVIGTEKEGITETVLDNADEYVRIPMYGFTESYNLSVSAAIIAHTLMEKLRSSNIKWQMSENELTDIKLEWVKRSLKSYEKLEEKFLEEKNK